MTSTTIQRIREQDETQGFRILVDRLWPRGVSKERARVEWWAKLLAPSAELRQWYHADKEARRAEFRDRYRSELDSLDPAEVLSELQDKEAVILLTDNKDVEASHVPVLQAWLDEQLAAGA